MRLDENYLERIGTDISGYIIKNPPIHRGIVFLNTMFIIPQFKNMR